MTLVLFGLATCVISTFCPEPFGPFFFFLGLMTVGYGFGSWGSGD